MSGKSRLRRKVTLTLRDVLNLFLGESIFTGDGSLEFGKVLEGIYGPFEESRHDDIAEICRRHVSALPGFRKRFRKDLDELESVIEMILVKSHEDPNSTEVEWDELGKILLRMEMRHGKSFSVPIIPEFRPSVPSPDTGGARYFFPRNFFGKRGIDRLRPYRFCLFYSE